VTDLAFRIRVRYHHPKRGLSSPRDGSQIPLGATVHMVCRAGRMVLIREDRGEHAVLRCWKLALNPRVPRGQGYGTRLHRAVEDRVRELGLLFCSADDATVEGNETTSAMRQRLLELYPDHVRVGDAFVLAGERAA
jgi:hypothetical protein